MVHCLEVIEKLNQDAVAEYLTTCPSKSGTLAYDVNAPATILLLDRLRDVMAALTPEVFELQQDTRLVRLVFGSIEIKLPFDVAFELTQLPVVDTESSRRLFNEFRGPHGR